jgi:hypothetical protein
MPSGDAGCCNRRPSLQSWFWRDRGRSRLASETSMPPNLAFQLWIVASETPCLRARSAVLAPASCSRKTPIICSSVNLARFFVRPSEGRTLTLRRGNRKRQVIRAWPGHPASATRYKAVCGGTVGGSPTYIRTIQYVARSSVHPAEPSGYRDDANPESNFNNHLAFLQFDRSIISASR